MSLQIDFYAKECRHIHYLVFICKMLILSVILVLYCRKSHLLIS